MSEQTMYGGGRTAPGQARGGGMPGWLMGCGIGCAILVLGVAVAVAGIGWFGYRLVGTAKGEVVKEFRANYDKLIEDGKVPEEYRPMLDHIVEIAEREDSSFWAATIGMTAVMSSLEDGVVSEKEAHLLTELRDFLSNNPGVGFIGLGKFLSAHPELQEDFDAAQERFSTMAEEEPQEEPLQEFEVEAPQP